MLIERYSCKGANVLHHKVAGNTTTYSGMLPTSGVKNVSLLVVVAKGSTTALTLEVKTADNASGTNAVAITADVPIYRENVRLTDAKTITETASSGTFVYTIDVPANIIPEGKYIGVNAAAGGNAADTFTVIAMPETYYHPSIV